MPPFSAVVLSGGRSSRFAGDKTRALVGGVPLLERVLAAVASAAEVVVVGPAVPLRRGDVTWAREHPPGAGPLAAVAAALPHLTAPVVVLLAADLPFAGPAVPHLVGLLARHDTDAVVPVDGSGRRQPLAAAYRTVALRAAVARLQPVDGRSMRDLLAVLAVRDVATSALPPHALLDVDTPAELILARSLGRADPDEEAAMLQEWTHALIAELDLDVEVDVDLVLELARDAAHGVSRPAAPLTTFLVGFAAASRGGDAAAITQASDTARLLATRWAPSEQP
jgi:molybdopterin-guanine dinucleotide biosynthesis protein A